MRAQAVGGLVGLVMATTASLALAEPIDGSTAHPGSAPRGLHQKKVAYADPSTPSGSAPAPMTLQAPPRKEGDSDGLLDPFRFGAIAGIGFPRPVSIEGFVKIEKIMGLGLEYSVLPDVSFAGVDAKMSAIMGDVRVFPLENGFFVGIAAGHQHLSAMSSVALPAQLGGGTPGITVDTWILNPRIGYLSTWSWGLTLGLDAGIQIPLSASTSSTIPSGVAFTPDPTGMANTFGKSVLPTVDLLRVGLLL